jgi:L-ascorbate metabolism protein UlaG (beta-lactamase superfamily)
MALALLLLAGPSAGVSAGGIEVVFLAGEGFMISCGHSKVLIDALFDLNEDDGKPPRAHDHLPPDGIERLEGAGKPFDNCDAVLVTHAHDDHFTAGCAANYMRANGWAVLAGPKDVTGSLAVYSWLAGQEGERLVTADVPAGEIDTIFIDGLTIYALGIVHTGCDGGAGKESPCIGHVAWLVESDGCRILHLGDAKVSVEEFEQFPWLPGLGIDIAFVPFWFLQQEGGARLITELIAPKAVVLMHWNSWNRETVVEELERNRDALPPAVIFSEAFEKISF